MNSNFLETNWRQLKELILLKWNKLTEDDLRQISGQFDQFVAKLQQRYGFSREQAEDEIRNWKPNLATENVTRTSREGTAPKWLPWALIGIPLLLLLGYLGNREADKGTVPAAPTTTQEVYSNSAVASDTSIVQAIRNALSRSDQLALNVGNLRIEAVNGVVTIRGTVQTAQQKDLITTIVNRIPSVIKVNNLVEVGQ